jgi:hypothetical protein
MIQTARKGKAFLLALVLGGLVAINLGAGIAIAAEKGEEVAAETTAEAQEDTPQNTGAEKKKGFLGKKFQEMKEKGIKKFAIDTVTTARRAGCTNTIFSTTNFGPALNNCIANYPEDMAKMLKDLKAEFKIKKKEREVIGNQIKESGEKIMYTQDINIWEYFSWAVQKKSREDQKIAREIHEKRDASVKEKELYKKWDNLTSALKKITKQLEPIMGASLLMAKDLTLKIQREEAKEGKIKGEERKKRLIEKKKVLFDAFSYTDQQISQLIKAEKSVPVEDESIDPGLILMLLFYAIIAAPLHLIS